MDLKEIDFKEYIEVLLKRRKIIIFVFLFIFIVALIYTLISQRVYCAKTTVIFSDTSRPYASIGGIGLPIDIGGAARRGGGSSMGLSSLLGPLIFETPPAVQNKLILESRKIRFALINKLDLYKAYRTRNTESLSGVLDRNTKVWINKDGLMTISFNSKKPELSARIANGYIEALRDYHSQSNISTAKRQRRFIEKQLEEKRQELKELEEKVEVYDKENKIYDEDLFLQKKLECLADLERGKLTAEVDVKSLEEDIKKSGAKYIKSFRASIKDAKKIPASNVGAIQQWRGKLADKEYELLLAKKSYASNHVKVKILEKELNQIKSTLREEYSQNIYAIEEGTSGNLIDKEMLLIERQSSLIAIQKALDDLNKEISSFPQKVFNYIKLKRELKIKEMLCSMLEQDLETAKIAEAKEAPELEVLDEATKESSTLISPNLKLNMLIAAFMGFVLGIVSAFGWEYLDRILEKNAVN